MRNPLRGKKASASKPASNVRDDVLKAITITDTDRMDRLVKHCGASREEIDVALRADQKFMRTKLVKLLRDLGAEYRWAIYTTSEQFALRDRMEKEVERMLVEECAV